MVGLWGNIVFGHRACDQRTSFWSWSLQVIIVAIIYLALAHISLSLGAVAGVASPFWLPAGLVFGVPLLLGPEALAGVFLGQLLSAWHFEHNLLWGSVLEASGNVLAGAVFRRVTLRLTRGGDIMATPRDFVSLLPGLFLGVLINAACGVDMLAAAGRIEVDEILRTGAIWAMGDLGGGLVVMPLMLAWAYPGKKAWNRRQTVEFAGLALLVLGLSAAVFYDLVKLPVYALSFALLPVLLVGAFRLDVRGMTVINVLMTAVAVAGTQAGEGPFKSDTAISSIAYLQAFVVVLVFTSLLVAAINRQRHDTMAKLRANAGLLEQQVSERTTLLQQALDEVGKTSETLRANENQFRYMLEASPIAVWIVTLSGKRLVFTNTRYQSLVQGLLPEGAGGAALGGEDFHPARCFVDDAEFATILADVEAGRRVFNRMAKLQSRRTDDAGKVTAWVLGSYVPIDYQNERAVLGWFYDISDRMRIEGRLIRLGQMYRAIIRCNDVIMRTHDENALMGEICRIAVEEGHLHLAWIGVIDEAAKRVRSVAQFGSGEEYVDNIVISTDPALPEGNGPGGVSIREGRVVVNNDYHNNPIMAPWRDQAMRYGWGASAAIPIRRGGVIRALLSVYHEEAFAFDDEIVGVLTEMCNNISFALDMLDLDDARHEAERKNILAARVFEDARDGILITDTAGIIVDVNPAFTKITGYSHDEVIGRSPNLLRSGRQSPEFYQTLWTELRAQGSWQGEIWNRRKNGELYAELITISALRDSRGDITHFVGLFTDITQIKHQQQRLELMAHYDVLTNLPNRLLFADRLNQTIARSKRDGSIFAVCFLDLDGFKQVNDSMGHQAGDLLLMEVAKRIRSSLREEDTVARLGGDEFALLLTSLQSIEICEQALSRLHDSLAKPFLIEDRLVTISASTGVTFYPSDESNPDTLLRHADQAMYQAKLLGRDRYHMFDAVQDQRIQSRRQGAAEVSAALEKGELELFYQPKVNMRTGEVVGAEALIRWRHPERGILSPVEFLPLIEGSDFEVTLGRWVIDQALTQTDIWRDQGLDINVSVNIAASHLQHPDFLTELAAACSRHPRMRPLQLELELLESSVLDDLLHVSDLIKTGREAFGVKFSLDDFGTGYSSLTHMRHLAVDAVKIDQSFVRDMIDDPDDWTIVEGVVGLANAFHRDVVAEGVESIRHGIMLLSLDCELAQGYVIAKPMPAKDLVEWAAGYKGFPEWVEAGEVSILPNDAQMLLLKLESDQWVDRIESCVGTPKGKLSSWPVMDMGKCHLGRWISHAAYRGRLNPRKLDRIRVMHEEMHEIGRLALELHDRGDDAGALATVRDLRRIQEELALLLNLEPEAGIEPLVMPEV